MISALQMNQFFFILYETVEENSKISRENISFLENCWKVAWIEAEVSWRCKDGHRCLWTVILSARQFIPSQFPHTWDTPVISKLFKTQLTLKQVFHIKDGRLF